MRANNPFLRWSIGGAAVSVGGGGSSSGLPGNYHLSPRSARGMLGGLTSPTLYTDGLQPAQSAPPLIYAANSRLNHGHRVSTLY